MSLSLKPLIELLDRIFDHSPVTLGGTIILVLILALIGVLIVLTPLLQPGRHP